MAETLIVGTRKTDDSTGPPTVFVNLNCRPGTILEAVTVAKATLNLPVDSFSVPVRIGAGADAGCSILGALSDAGCAGIREAGVAQAAAGLAEGELWLPRQAGPVPLPMASLGDLGNRGLYHMDISGTEIIGSGLPRGPFDIAPITDDGIPTWPALWGHDAGRESRLVVTPDRQGIVRPGCDARATEAWEQTVSRLHFNRDFRLNSQPLAACMTPGLTIGGTAWPNFLCTNARWETPLALWANSTLGLIAFWWVGTIQQLGRARISISKLPALAALDTRQLSHAQLDRADAMFEEFKDLELLPANEAWRDETRQALDRAMLIDLLSLPEDIMEPLALLRRQWCAEPSVHGGKGTAPW